MISTFNPNTSNDLFAFSQQKHTSSKDPKETYTEHEIERMKLCGILFERKAVINKDLVNEFFRRQPCFYNQVVYKNAARIYHCLKADLNENPILKSLKQQQAKESGKSIDDDKQIAEVPKLNYENCKEKKSTLQLAFSTLKFQKVLEDLLDECQFYGNYSQFKDEQSLVCTILFDYMTRKFEIRDKLIEEPFDNQDLLVTEIEYAIHREKTDLAAELAKNRIKADASTLEELLPKELREVEQHRAELPIYCWINQLKTTVTDMIDKLINTDELNLVENKKNLDRKCFMIDPHCPNVVMFHYALRDKIINSDYVKNFELIVQDKSSCLAPHSVIKLLSKKDEVIVTNVSGGLVAAFIGCMMEEFDGKVYVYGATDEEKYQEISNKLQQIGCSKYVKLMREDFLEVRPDEPKLENAKVILINAPCSKSALMNPMEFLFQEGEDVKYLRDYTLDVNNPNKIKKCIQDETGLLKHALRFSKIRAIVYQTYSKHSSENEGLISKLLLEYNENRKSNNLPYKLSPPVIPLTSDDIQNDEVVKNFKYLQFKPSNKMNGSFIALITRDKDLNTIKEANSEKKQKKMSAPQPATFEEKNFLKLSNDEGKTRNNLIPKKLTNLRRKSTGPSLQTNKSSLKSAYVAIEQEIKQLQIRNNLNLNSTNSKEISTSIEPISFKPAKTSDFQSKLSQIGKLDSKKIDHLTPNRSSTPDENKNDQSLNKQNKTKTVCNKSTIKNQKDFLRFNILNAKFKKEYLKPHIFKYENKTVNGLNSSYFNKRVRFNDNVNSMNSAPNNSFESNEADKTEQDQELLADKIKLELKQADFSEKIQRLSDNYKANYNPVIKDLSSLVMPIHLQYSEFKNEKSNDYLKQIDSLNIMKRVYSPVRSNNLVHIKKQPTNDLNNFFKSNISSLKDIKFDVFQVKNTQTNFKLENLKKNGILKYPNRVYNLHSNDTIHFPMQSLKIIKKSQTTSSINKSNNNKNINNISYIDMNMFWSN